MNNAESSPNSPPGSGRWLRWRAYLVGLSKTGIAGLGVLSVALFASALPARESTGIVLIVLIAADIVAVITYRRAGKLAAPAAPLSVGSRRHLHWLSDHGAHRRPDHPAADRRDPGDDPGRAVLAASAHARRSPI